MNGVLTSVILNQQVHLKMKTLLCIKHDSSVRGLLLVKMDTKAYKKLPELFQYLLVADVCTALSSQHQ